MGGHGYQASTVIPPLQETTKQPHPTWTTQQAEAVRGHATDGMPFLRHKLTLAGHDQDTITLMMGAWRESTKKQYTSYIKRWEKFAEQHKWSVLEPKFPQVCTFLRKLSQEGLAHGAVNTARSALSLILPKIQLKEFGKQTEVSWLIKSIYEKNPPQPKYSAFWDVGKVFTLFTSWPENNLLTLKHLTWKLNMLLLLVSSQRGQTIVNLSVDGIILKKDFVVFKMKKLMKHNRVGDPLDTIIFHAYDKNPKLCVVRTIKAYLCIVGPHRKQIKQLLISLNRPFHAITRDTVARWTLHTLKAAGVDTQVYKSHSTRGASASATRASGVNINLIMKHAGWRCEESFARHYNKQLDRENSQFVANNMIDCFDQ